MENIYEICFYGGLALAIIFLIVSVVLFIVLKIPKVIGELTGKSAKKGIKEMKDGVPGRDSISKREQAKYYNQGSGKITAREGVSAEKRKENRDNTTDLLKSKKPAQEDTEILGAEEKSYDPEETEVLSGKYDEESTDVLASGNDESTEVLTSGDDDSTDVLTSGDDDSTDVLTSKDDDSTDVLTSKDDDSTDVLTSKDDDSTDVLTSEEDATDVLTDKDEDATDVLRVWDDVDENGATTVLSGAKTSDKLARKYRVECNVVVTHTDETL